MYLTSHIILSAREQRFDVRLCVYCLGSGGVVPMEELDLWLEG